MPTAPRDPQEEQLETLLREAHAALDRGDVRAGRETSQRILKAAEASGHQRFEARALLHARERGHVARYQAKA